MRYNFETYPVRRGVCAYKWEDMLQKKPDAAEDVVPFSVADMEFYTCPDITRGLAEYLDTHTLGYGGPTGEYLQTVCDWMRQQHGWEIAPDWIVPTCGVVPAIHTAVKAFCQPGDGVIVFTPVYYPFYSAAELNGCVIRRCPLVNVDGEYSIDFPLLEELAKEERTTMLIFCSPHNPVGRVWSREELRRIGEICIENNVRIISDEIHFDIVLPGSEHTVFPLAGDFGDKIIVCTAPSKTFNLAALHTSNIVIPNEQDRERFRGAMGMDRPTTLGLESCRLAYTRGRAWMEEMLQVVARNDQTVRDFLAARLPQIKASPLQGTYLLWLDCRSLGLDAKALEQRMIENDLFFDEGYLFGAEGEGFERMNLACPTRLVEQAMLRFEKAVKG